MLMQIWSTHEYASMRGSQTILTSEVLYGPVRPLEAETPRKPKTMSSGETPSELVDLGLSWSRQATQNALERRRDEQRTARGCKS